MKKNNKIILISIFFLLFGIVSSLVFNGISFSTISHVEPKNTIIRNSQRIFVKGDKIVGKFEAKEPYLGILEVRLNKYSGVNYTGNDRLIFRIKQDDSNKWYYENIYPISEFEKSFILPFGFPVINDSKNKQYDFEIISLEGNGINSVKLSKQEPVVQSVYQFPKQEISSPKFFLQFIYIKSTFSLVNFDFLLSSVFYFIPFFFYLIWLFVKNRINVVKRFMGYLAVLFIFLDSFLISGSHAGVILLFIGIWIMAVFIYKLESSVTFLISLLFITVVTFLVLFKIMTGQEKLLVYTYFFLILGVVQSLYELKAKPSKLVDYKHFLKEILNSNEK